MTHPCLDRCGRMVDGRGSRCATCERRRQRITDARRDPVKRQAYRDPLYLVQPRHGVCWICGKPGADTRDHVSPIALQMLYFGEVKDHRTRPAHRACNSARGMHRA